MGFREIPLKGSYLSELDDLVEDFFEPVLAEAVAYDRIAGYFNSKSLAAASTGIAGFVRNEGKMRLLCSPQLSSGDLTELLLHSSHEERNQLVEAKIMNALDEFDRLEDLFLNDHVRALSWMLSTGHLEMKIAVPVVNTSTLLHVKMGLLRDTYGNEILFKGSINETGAGWTVNSEQFDTWTSWNNFEKIRSDQDVFDSYWYNRFAKPRFEIVGISEAVKRRLLTYAPAHFEDLKLDRKSKTRKSRRIELRNYQDDAVTAWIQAGRRGFVEMATGAGKTRTAHACILRTIAEIGRVFTVVTVPYAHIADQWMEELKELDPILVPGQGNWKARLSSLVNKVKLGIIENAVVVVVQNTASSSTFTKCIEDFRNSKVRLFFVGDECHGLGASTFQNALIEDYEFRLGLSATPERYFDEEGSSFLAAFFGDSVFVFSLEQALQLKNPLTGLSYLCPYLYEFKSVSLDHHELEQYRTLTQKAMAANGGGQIAGKLSEKAQLLLIQRSRIVKKASEKILALETMLQSISHLEHALIYCEDEDQLNQVSTVLNKLSIRYHRFTGRESTKPNDQYQGASERESLIRSLADGSVQALVAIKCLDEGVDVPSARTAFILASSGSPREFIQRRGRVLRRTPGKEIATIVDFLVVPSDEYVVYDPSERKIFVTECRRLRELCSSALNRLNVEVQLTKLLEIYGV